MLAAALDNVDEMVFTDCDQAARAAYGRLAAMLAWVAESFDQVVAERDAAVARAEALWPTDQPLDPLTEIV